MNSSYRYFLKVKLKDQVYRVRAIDFPCVRARSPIGNTATDKAIKLLGDHLEQLLYLDEIIVPPTTPKSLYVHNGYYVSVDARDIVKDGKGKAIQKAIDVSREFV